MWEVKFDIEVQYKNNSILNLWKWKQEKFEWEFLTTFVLTLKIILYVD